ncbi:hypothetical protein [Allonocardiopsis opalescens]|uniref:hypothetical protein n=1 Tax=Allonocardiopsis opalescens TaxID=1144618 RepID=UPI001B80E583|nr:hypothetical protein [Allonocardiopsis opalescens]
MGTERIPYLLGHAEIARLFGVAADTPQLWRKRSLLGEPDLVISGKPYWLLPTVLALARPGGREVDPDRLAEYKADIPNGYLVQALDGPPSLIGIKEVSWIFGKKPSDIGQWRNRGTLARQDLLLSGSPLWFLHTIIEDAERRGRAVSAEAVERIQAGEREQPLPRRQRGVPPASMGRAFPAAQVFTSGESVAAVAFLRRILNAGYAVEVRPRPAGERSKHDRSTNTDPPSGPRA